MPLHEGLAGLVAEQVRPVAVDDASHHPRFKYFKESGEEEYHSFLGVPAHRSRHPPGRPRRADQGAARLPRQTRSACSAEAAEQVAPVVSEARTLDRFVAPAQERLWALARNVWWSWDHDCIDLFRDLNPVRGGASFNQNPIALLNEMPLERNRAPRHRTRPPQPHQLRLPPPAGVSARRPHLGRGQCRHTPSASRRLLLCGIRTPRIAAHLLRRPRRPLRRSHQERIRPRHPARRRRPLLRPGLLPPAPRRKGLAARRVSRDRHQPATHAARQWARWPARHRRNRHPRRRHSRQGLASQGRPLRSLSSRLQRARQRPEDLDTTSRLYGGDSRTRIRQELLLGVGGFRALKAMGISPSVLHLNEGHSGFAVFEAIRRAWKRKASTSTPPPARFPAKSSSLPTRPSPPAMTASIPISSKNTSDRCAISSASRTRTLMGFGREHPDRPWRALLHDRPRPQARAPRQRRLLAARRRSRAPCGRACIPAVLKTPSPSATSPTASTSRRG